MRSWRETPDGIENTEATKQNEREIFALKMQAKQGVESTMSAQSQYEREEQDIQDRCARGEISSAEMRAELNELRRDYRAAAQEAAQGAYEQEMERWGLAEPES